MEYERRKMKTIIIITVTCIIAIMLTRYLDYKYYENKKHNTDMLIFGNDTIVITGAKGINYSKLTHCSLHGYTDTTTGIFYTKVRLNIPDSERYKYYNGNQPIEESITLPKNSVTLSGSGTDGDSLIVTYPIIIFDTTTRMVFDKKNQTFKQTRKKVKDSDSTYHYIYY